MKTAKQTKRKVNEELFGAEIAALIDLVNNEDVDYDDQDQKTECELNE